jgi:membrane protease YdiL (CAAX protease family)
MTEPPRTPTDPLEKLIEQDIRDEIGNPVPVTFAATVVYLPLLVAGLLASIFWTKTLPGPSKAVVQVLEEVGLGAVIALILVLVTYVLARTVKPFEVLEKEFRIILGDLSRRDIVWIAFLSGGAEELVFRGTLQPWLAGLWGPSEALVATSLVFGLLHYVPDRVFLPWTIFATVVGFICGGLFLATQSPVAPAVTHMLLNAINLGLIVNGPPLRKTSP